MSSNKPTALELLPLGLEYNESWAEARKRWHPKSKPNSNTEGR